MEHEETTVHKVWLIAAAIENSLDLEWWAVPMPSGFVGRHNDLVAGNWRGYCLFYSEVAGIVGVSILLDETVQEGSDNRGPKLPTHSWPILRLSPMFRGNLKGRLRSS